MFITETHRIVFLQQVTYKILGISHRETTDTIVDVSRLPGLDGNKEVLARWSDDGWYYHGHVIKEDRHRNKYIVQDATGYREAISIDNIIIEDDHNVDAVQVNYPVLIMIYTKTSL